MITLKLKEFLEQLKAQGVPKEHMAFKCPVCHTVQSAHDLIEAGAGKDFNEVERYLGFSCLGRFTGGSSDFNTNPGIGKGCDYTLGGLVVFNKLEVIDEEGEKHPRFEIATPEEAHAHTREMGAIG